MARSARSLSRRRGSFARPTNWENLIVDFSHPSAASTVFLDMTPSPIRSLSSGVATIVRMIGHMEWFSANSTGPPPVAMHITCGVAVVTADAIAGAVLPDPLDEAEHGWLYWTNRTLLLGQDGQGKAITSWDFDIRTSRKLRGGYGLVFITETVAEEFASVARLSIRNLWKGPLG